MHFSAQELVDCVQNPLNCGGKGGCDGATVELAMDWAVYKGLQSLREPPATFSEGTCKKSLFRTSKAEQGTLDTDGRLMSMVKPIKEMSMVESKSELSIGLASYQTLPTNQYKPLLRAVLTGPVAISVDASMWSLYGGGIFDECGHKLPRSITLSCYLATAARRRASTGLFGILGAIGARTASSGLSAPTMRSPRAIRTKTLRWVYPAMVHPRP